MGGIEREHEAVEEAAAVAGGAGEEAVHRGRQPDHPGMFGQGIGALWRAVDAHLPAGLAGDQAGADADVADGPLHGGRDGEAAGSAVAGHVGEGGPAQAPSRSEQRQGFQQIGLAGAVVADEGDGAPAEDQGPVRVVAEIGEAEIGDEDARRAVDRHGWPLVPAPGSPQTRMGIRTYSVSASPTSWISVGEPGSASRKRAVSPVSCEVMSSR